MAVLVVVLLTLGLKLSTCAGIRLPNYIPTLQDYGADHKQKLAKGDCKNLVSVGETCIAHKRNRWLNKELKFCITLCWGRYFPAVVAL